MASHVDPTLQVPGASPEASIIIKQVLASMIAGVTTHVTQTDDVQNINVNVIAMDTGLKFTFVLPSAAAVASAMTADIVMSDVSINPVQNRVIKAYVDGKFWTGTAAEYALLADDTDIICFLSDTNVIMYNGESYSLNVHTHGNLTNAGAIGALAGLVVMTGAGGVLETVTVDDLKELLGASSGMNLLHNGEFASPFNTAGLTIYSTPGECLDRWNLLGGTLTINAGHATLSQAAINTAQLRQSLPIGSYQRLMGQTLSLSVLLDDNQTVFEDSGVIDGVASTIMTVPIANGYSIRLVVDNSAKTTYVEINGGASVAAIDLFRVKLEIGATSSIEDGVTDAALDWARILLFDVNGIVRNVTRTIVEAATEIDAIADADGLILNDATASVGAKTKFVLWSAIKTALRQIFMPHDATPTNLLINGCFDHWQDGATFVNPVNGKYTADGWMTGLNTADGGTYPTITISKSEHLPHPYPSRNFFRFNTNGAGSSLGTNSLYVIRQKIEHGTRLYAGYGNKITVSFLAYTTIPGKKIGVRLVQRYGTGGSPSASEAIAGAFFTLSVNPTVYSHTFTLNTKAGKTFGTNPDDVIDVEFVYMWGASQALQVGASAAETFVGAGDVYTAWAQVNVGSVALPFVPRSFADELRLCQRYAVVSGVSNALGARMLFYTPNYIVFLVKTPVTMRSNPTLLGIAGTDTVVLTTTASPQTGFTFSAVAVPSGVYITATKTSHGLTDAVLLFSAAGGFDARL